jgi:YD repeat-containing protein
LDQKILTLFFYRNALGNIVTKIDRGSRAISWTFDKRNRPTFEIWYDSLTSFRANKPHKKITTTYNNRGKLESINDGENKFTFSYGAFGNEIKQTQNLSGFRFRKTKR